MKNIILVCAVFFSFLITFDLFLKEPPVWPDEATLTYISSISDGNLINNYQKYPSFYISLLYYWFKLTGVSIEAQRILSVSWGIIFIIVFCLFILKISKISSKKSFLIPIPIILLITDFTFLQATRVGRPEIITLLFGLISTYFLFIFLASNNQKLLLLVLSLIFANLSFFFHMNGFIYLLSFLTIIILSFRKLSKQHQKILVFCTTCFFFFSIALVVTGLISLKGIISRLLIANAQDNWFFTVLNSKPFELKFIYISFITVSFLFILFVFQKRKLNLIIFLFPLVLSWIVMLINKDFWYAVYIIPFIYIAVFILLCDYYQEWQVTKSNLIKIKVIGLYLVCLIIFLSNLKVHLDILLLEGGDKYSYQKYIGDIEQIIPDNTTVFTSSIPDPYYAFILRKNNKIIRFPQGFVEKNDYLKELNESDFIIYNGPYGNNYYGDLVMDYLKINVFKIVKLDNPNQYQAIIVELKPKYQRTDP